MFSGIVEAVGRIEQIVEAADGGRTFTITSPFTDLALGESVCVSGVCLTVTRTSGAAFGADLSLETLRRTSFGDARAERRVNLERSLRLGDRLSGHLVFGHVDGVGRLEATTPEGDSALYRFSAPPEVSRYLVEKGSVTVDGVSLTVFACGGGSFTVAVIPHTAAVTTLGITPPGTAVHLEADMIGKYVEKFVGDRFPGGQT